MKPFAVVAATAAGIASANICAPPQDHSITWRQTKCDETNPGKYEKYLGYGEFQTRVVDAAKYCQVVGEGARGIMDLVSVTSSDLDTCLNDLLNTAKGIGAQPTVSIGAVYENNSKRWVWADGSNYMSSAADYNNCVDINDAGVCASSDGSQCLIATEDSTNGYHWESFPCFDAHVNFVCQYSCNPIDDTNPDDNGDDPTCPPDNWWCDPNRAPFMKEMIGFVGNTSADANIYIQEQDMTMHSLPLPAKDDGTNAQFPYIAYNQNAGAFEVVGSFNQPSLSAPNGNGNGSYHYYVDFQGNSQSLASVSQYDSRSYAAFVFIPDVQSTILVGGYPPSASDSYNYNRVTSRPLIYATSQATGNLNLPTAWPSNYHCNNSPGTCKFLSFPVAKYHANQLFVVGGSSYAYCPQPALGGNSNVWSLRFQGAPGSTLQWQTYRPLSSNYGTCRGVIGFPDLGNGILLTTLNYEDAVTSFQGFEYYNYGGNSSYAVASATKYGNDMPVQFLNLKQNTWNVMGGAMRDASANMETIRQGLIDEGFSTSTTPNFPNSLYGVQLLGASISNQYSAPFYN